ncbi:hypothetical protein Gasu2_22310 [Galdieria sulphuraria]|uniref:Uncharacterized protein n=1 Tax=Galdieria sulphuraria TaxID=130081 RepID=M2X821_GALSU|nr:uncharacterized protein Gasu_00720 [Galdieria sulphuraria]EME32705.1 hypothetical protein Gasu_00720 [Galdieria sulphuraria]GJD07906.1 hypothetical protein Gasu2_22310 [Galdieria sulphuraria]|eukprot:XP_005709225.1 hypothetical protein Gasu_00720 [Galdieria sulphuraria]
MPLWLLITLVLSHILITVFACLAAVLLYFLLRNKQRQYIAARKQAKAIVDEYEKLETNRRQISASLDKETWNQRQKMKSLQEEVLKLQNSILSVRKEKEELELRCKEISHTRDLLNKKLEALQNNSSGVLKDIPSGKIDAESVVLEQSTQTTRSTASNPPADSTQPVFTSDLVRKNIFASTDDGTDKVPEEDFDDSECEYDFILKDSSATKSDISDGENG